MWTSISSFSETEKYTKEKPICFSVFSRSDNKYPETQKLLSMFNLAIWMLLDEVVVYPLH